MCIKHGYRKIKTAKLPQILCNIRPYGHMIPIVRIKFCSLFFWDNNMSITTSGLHCRWQMRTILCIRLSISYPSVSVGPSAGWVPSYFEWMTVMSPDINTILHHKLASDSLFEAVSCLFTTRLIRLELADWLQEKAAVVTTAYFWEVEKFELETILEAPRWKQLREDDGAQKTPCGNRP